MSYKARAVAEREAEPPKSYNCPAYGCPNAASVSFDHGSRWACYTHARAEANDWRDVTEYIRQGWPATANWNHLAKTEREAEKAAERRAALPPPCGPVGMTGADEWAAP